jgi:hypothetical protein
MKSKPPSSFPYSQQRQDYYYTGTRSTNKSDSIRFNHHNRSTKLRMLTATLINNEIDSIIQNSINNIDSILTKIFNETLETRQHLFSILPSLFVVNPEAQLDVGIMEALHDLIIHSYSSCYLGPALSLLLNFNPMVKLEMEEISSIIRTEILLGNTTTTTNNDWPYHVAYYIISLIHLLDQFAVLKDQTMNCCCCCCQQRPSLFRRQSVFKSSSSMIYRLCDLLSAPNEQRNLETKLLKFVHQFTISYQQTKLDDYYLHVDPYNLKSLQDGIVLLMLTQHFLFEGHELPPTSSSSNNNIMTSIRVPAISRLQKIHNMNIVLNMLFSTSKINNTTSSSSSSLPWVKYNVRDLLNNQKPDLMWKFAYSLFHHFKLSLSPAERKFIIDQIKQTIEIHYEEELFQTTITRLISESPTRFPLNLFTSSDDSLLILWVTIIMAKQGFHIRSCPHSFESGTVFVELIVQLFDKNNNSGRINFNQINDWVPGPLHPLAIRLQKEAFTYVQDFCSRVNILYPFELTSSSSSSWSSESGEQQQQQQQQNIPCLPSYEAVMVFLVLILRYCMKQQGVEEEQSHVSPLKNYSSFDLVEYFTHLVHPPTTTKFVVPEPESIIVADDEINLTEKHSENLKELLINIEEQSITTTNDENSINESHDEKIIADQPPLPQSQTKKLTSPSTIIIKPPSPTQSTENQLFVILKQLRHTQRNNISSIIGMNDLLWNIEQVGLRLTDYVSNSHTHNNKNKITIIQHQIKHTASVLLLGFRDQSNIVDAIQTHLLGHVAITNEEQSMITIMNMLQKV